MDDAWEEPGTQNANVESDAKKSKKATPASKKVVSARKGKAKQAKKKGPKERSSKVSKAKTTRTKSAQSKGTKKVSDKKKEKQASSSSSSGKVELETPTSSTATHQNQSRRNELLEIQDDSPVMLRLRTTKSVSVTQVQTPAISFPIVYGSVAWWLGRKQGEQNSHKWMLYVRGVDCEDISHVVKSVEFTLHSSFTNPVRVIKNHPFELTEYGWGEFEVKIRLNFNDPGEKPLDTYHALRLYPPGGLQPSLKRPVVSEYYDEVVFNRPSDSFSRLLLRPVEHRMPLQLHPMRDVFARFDEERDLKTVTDALAYVEKETRAIKQRIEELG